MRATTFFLLLAVLGAVGSVSGDEAKAPSGRLARGRGDRGVPKKLFSQVVHDELEEKDEDLKEWQKKNRKHKRRENALNSQERRHENEEKRVAEELEEQEEVGAPASTMGEDLATLCTPEAAFAPLGYASDVSIKVVWKVPVACLKSTEVQIDDFEFELQRYNEQKRQGSGKWFLGGRKTMIEVSKSTNLPGRVHNAKRKRERAGKQNSGAGAGLKRQVLADNDTELGPLYSYRIMNLEPDSAFNMRMRGRLADGSATPWVTVQSYDLVEGKATGADDDENPEVIYTDEWRHDGCHIPMGNDLHELCAPKIIHIGPSRTGSTFWRSMMRAQDNVVFNSFEAFGLAIAFDPSHPPQYPYPLLDEDGFWKYYLERVKGAPKVGSDKILVEKTPHYFYDVRLPYILHDLIPDVVLVAGIREPSEKLYSQYTQSILSVVPVRHPDKQSTCFDECRDNPLSCFKLFLKRAFMNNPDWAKCVGEEFDPENLMCAHSNTLRSNYGYKLDKTFAEMTKCVERNPLPANQEGLARLAGNVRPLDYVQGGCYTTALDRYTDAGFEIGKNLIVYKFTDFQRDPEKVGRETFRLALPDATFHYDADKMSSKNKNAAKQAREPLDHDTKAFVQSLFAPWTKKLQDKYDITFD